MKSASTEIAESAALFGVRGCDVTMDSANYDLVFFGGGGIPTMAVRWSV